MVVPQQQLDFVSRTAPFDGLPVDQIEQIVSQLSLMYVTEENKQDLIPAQGAGLYLVHSGQFSVKDSDAPERHISEGDYFNHANLLDGLNAPLSVQVDRAGLIYCLPTEAFTDCCKQHPAVQRFFASYQADDLQTDALKDSNSMWLYRSVGDMLEHEPVSMESNNDILEGVRLMSAQAVSSLLITEKEALVGILTDRDIRNRIVAPQLDLTRPIADVMSADPVMIGHQRTMFDALCKMAEHNIHHLPVVDQVSRQPLGMLTASDMVRHQRSNVLFLIGNLAKAGSLYELTRLSWQMPHYFAQHAKRLGDFDVAGKVLSQATDIMTRKLITFFQQKNGHPPCDYCWLVYGSQAREDQTMGSDQDNGLLLARTVTEQEAEYFASMSEYICRGLGKCGIKLCSGNIMASNPALRLSLAAAVEEARAWVKAPTNQAIMHFNIFLDVRAVAGNPDLFRQLQQQRAPLLKQNMFLAALARHSNDISVPLSVFQKFVFEKSAAGSNCIDLKKNAVAIINNIVRIYALSQDIRSPSTPARLNKLKNKTDMTETEIHNLRDIWLFLNRLRWRHQLTNKATDNLVCVDDLSSIEKYQLKTAFKSIKRAQQAALMRFSGGLAG